MTYRYNRDRDDPKVRHLARCQLSEEAIAARLHLDLRSVRIALDRLNLSSPRKKSSPTDKPEDPLPQKSADLNSPMPIAFLTFGERLKEVNGAYRLDGTPIRFFDLMKRVNCARKNEGREQIGPADWRTP
jgi:hypothetical protein